MKIQKQLLIFFCLIFNTTIQAQETLRLSLPEVVALAQSDAPDVLIEQTRLTNNYWRYQSFLSDYKPQITLDATLPALERSIQSYLLPDGSNTFLEQSALTANAGLALRQDIVSTGGTIFAGLGIDYINNFKLANQPAQTSYFSRPIYVGFQQPLFQFNALKWNKKVEPLRYEESTRAYAENMEAVASDAANLFFEVYLAQLNLKAAILDKANADTLYRISAGRFEVGRIAETEVLQIELSAMRANADLAAAQLNLQTATEALRNFLGLKEVVVFDLVPPTNIPNFLIDVDNALKLARNNRSETIEFQRRLMQAEQDVAQAKGESGLNVNLFGSFGLSQTGETIGASLTNPNDQEQISVGIQMPIADWGKAKSRMKIAESNKVLEQQIIEQERISFEREIILKVQQFDLVRKQVALAVKAYEVAQKRQDITRKRYRIGKLDVSDLNLAIREQDESRQSYMTALRGFWLAYYELRQLTLYDFENDKPLFKRLEIE